MAPGSWEALQPPASLQICTPVCGEKKSAFEQQPWYCHLLESHSDATTGQSLHGTPQTSSRSVAGPLFLLVHLQSSQKGACKCETQGTRLMCSSKLLGQEEGDGSCQGWHSCMPFLQHLAKFTESNFLVIRISSQRGSRTSQALGQALWYLDSV